MLVKCLTLFRTVLRDSLCQNLTYILSSLCFTMDFWVFLILPSPILEKLLRLSRAHHWIICEENWPIARNDQGSVAASTHSLAQWEKPRSTSRWILLWFSLPLRITGLLWSCAHPQLILWGNIQSAWCYKLNLAGWIRSLVFPDSIAVERDEQDQKRSLT